MTVYTTPRNTPPDGSQLHKAGRLVFLCSVENVDVWFDPTDAMCPIGLHYVGHRNIDWSTWTVFCRGERVPPVLSREAVDFIKAAIQLISP